MNAAILSVYHGWNDGISDIMNTPRIGYQRHGRLGGVAGTLVAVANGIIKPLVGTLSAVTWLCRGVYASVNKIALADEGEEASAVNTIGLDSSSTTDNANDDISEADTTIATETGFKPEVCKRILSQFDEIKKQRVDTHFHQHQS
jgi:hypothetical protein